MAVMARQFKPGQLQTGSLYNISSSYALTASFALNGGGTSIDTGSFLTTASFNSFTASYNSGSFTGSFVGVLVGTASNATTASYIQNAQTASYALQSVSSSFATTASYVNPLNQNVQLTGSLYLSTPEVASVYFSGSSAASRLVWNDTDGTLNLGLKGGNVTLQIGQEQVVRVVNKTGGFLFESEYKAVRIRRVDEGGAQGQRLAIVLAQAIDDANSADTLGIVTETIVPNQEGFITNSGLVRGIDTTGALQGETWTDGDVLYLSPTTAGGITTTKPQAPQHTVIMGYVVYAHQNNGTIFVKVDNGYEIDELHNVKITTGSLTPGQLLVRSGSTATGVWINTNQLTGSYGLTGSLTATSFTGSLFGTASWANNAITAQTASYVLNAVSSSFATTASYALNAVSSSFATTASFAATSSAALLNLATGDTRSYALTMVLSSSAAPPAFTSPRNPSPLAVRNELVFNGNTGVLQTTASVALTASVATTASHALEANTVLPLGVGKSTGFITHVSSTGSMQPVKAHHTFKIDISAGGATTINLTGSLIASSITSSLQGTASFATSASFAPSTPTFPFTGSALITGSLGITGSLSVIDGNGANNLNTNVRTLYGSNGSSSIDWSNRQLNAANGSTRLDWKTLRLIDSATSQSIDWGSRVLTDANTTTAVDWNGRTLRDSSGAGILSVDWRNRLLHDTDTSQSIDWASRRLLDQNQNFSVLWKDRVAYDSNASQSIHWNDRALSNSSGTTVVDWEHLVLTDPNAITSIDWSNRVQYDGSGVTSIDWGNRYLSDQTANAIIDYSGGSGYNIRNSRPTVETLELTVQDEFTQTSVGFTINTNTAGNIIQVGPNVNLAVTASNPVFLDTDGIWKRSNQTTDTTTKLLGICVETYNKGQILTEGIITVTTASGYSDTTPFVSGSSFYGMPVYLTGSTATFTTDKPTSGYVRVVGHMYYNSTTTPDYWIMKFNPSNDWYEI